MAFGNTDRTCNLIIGVLISAIVHVALCLFLLVASRWEFAPPKPDENTPVTELLMMSPPPPPPPPAEPAEPEPAPPVPEPPKPEPPKPEPPKPEPPKPEPPKPEPLRPEPPKPAPPKPEPLKPEPPKPAPPKPEPPKPKPKTRQQSIQERLQQAKVHYQQPRPQPAQPRVRQERPLRSQSAAEVNRRWAEQTQVAPVETSTLTGKLRQQLKAATPEEEAVNYGDQVVRPILYEAWDTPRSGGTVPQPVVVELDIAADGRVISSRLVRRSNDVRMNQSVEELMRRVRRFTPFAELGIRATSMRIVVTMTVSH